MDDEKYLELRDEIGATLAIVADLGYKLASVTSAVTCLAETHHDSVLLCQKLEEAKLKLEAVLGASTAPDPAISSTISLLSQLVKVIQQSQRPS